MPVVNRTSAGMTWTLWDRLAEQSQEVLRWYQIERYGRNPRVLAPPERPVEVHGVLESTEETAS